MDASASLRLCNRNRHDGRGRIGWKRISEGWVFGNDFKARPNGKILLNVFITGAGFGCAIDNGPGETLIYLTGDFNQLFRHEDTGIMQYLITKTKETEEDYGSGRVSKVKQRGVDSEMKE